MDVERHIILVGKCLRRSQVIGSRQKEGEWGGAYLHASIRLTLPPSDQVACNFKLLRQRKFKNVLGYVPHTRTRGRQSKTPRNHSAHSALRKCLSNAVRSI